jgi:hypothetical protein
MPTPVGLGHVHPAGQEVQADWPPKATVPEGHTFAPVGATVVEVQP